MSELISVYLEDLETGGQNGFQWFEDEDKANKHFKKVNDDIAKYGKQQKFKAVKRVVDYDRYNNRVSFN